MSERIGPEVRIHVGCGQCDRIESVDSSCQGDTSYSYYCTDLKLPERKRIPNPFKTPDWCPHKDKAVAELVRLQSKFLVDTETAGSGGEK